MVNVLAAAAERHSNDLAYVPGELLPFKVGDHVVIQTRTPVGH